MMIKATRHKVCYYETDAMKCVHHSNYIRWFEMARCDFLEQIGLPYSVIEDDGYVSPILSVNCEYKDMTRYGDEVYILTELQAFTGITFTLGYEVVGLDDGKLKVKGSTKLCLLDKEGKIVNIKKLGGKYLEVFSGVLGKKAEIPEE